MRILVRDLGGKVQAIEGQEGETLLEAMLNAGLAVKATCFGCCNCSTCHVRVDPEWYDRLAEPEEQECDVLEMAVTRTDASRLACQVILSLDVAGLTVALTEEAVA